MCAITLPPSNLLTMERIDAGGGAVRQTIAIPAVVIDTLLPDLKDTELRLLLVVLRQTWGRGKEADWLSHTQLKARTGRASEAVSGALDTLVRRGLLTVRDEHGVTLSEPDERQRSRARLHLCPGPLLHLLAPGVPAGKPKTTVKDDKERRCFRKTSVAAARRAPLPAVNPDTHARAEDEKRRIRETLTRISRNHRPTDTEHCQSVRATA